MRFDKVISILGHSTDILPLFGCIFLFLYCISLCFRVTCCTAKYVTSTSALCIIVKNTCLEKHISIMYQINVSHASKICVTNHII